MLYLVGPKLSLRLACSQISWGQTTDPTDWGSQWIADHQTSQASANKPVIVEEFGVTSDQLDTYTAWYSEVVSSGLTGDLLWWVVLVLLPELMMLNVLNRQAGSHLPTGDTPQDGYAVRHLMC